MIQPAAATPARPASREHPMKQARPARRVGRPTAWFALALSATGLATAPTAAAPPLLPAGRSPGAAVGAASAGLLPPGLPDAGATGLPARGGTASSSKKGISSEKPDI